MLKSVAQILFSLMDLISGLKSVALFQSLKSKKKFLKETQNEAEYDTKTASIIKTGNILRLQYSLQMNITQFIVIQ